MYSIWLVPQVIFKKIKLLIEIMIQRFQPFDGKLKKHAEVHEISCTDGKDLIDNNTSMATQNINNESRVEALRREPPSIIPQSSETAIISSVYNEERMRLDSFKGWTTPFIDKKKLALFGFYYIGPDDTVKCNFCKVEIGRWDRGDNVLVEHLRWSPKCPLLRKRQTPNVPLDLNLLLSNLPPETSYDDCGTYATEYRPNAYPESESVPFKTNYPDFSLENDRLNSFGDWPISIKQKPHELADAGFFYIGKGDQVKCFSCGGGLKDWEEEDIPWEQHALFYEECPYLELVKGKEYIIKVKNALISKSNEKEEEGSVSIDIPPTNFTNSFESRSSDGRSNDTKMCKICFNEDLNTTLMPCMHVVACAKCALSLQQCPICRKNITDVKRIYFS